MATKKIVQKKAVVKNPAKKTLKGKKVSFVGFKRLGVGGKVAPELLSYTIKCLISVGSNSYSNIQPEFSVKAETLEDAHAFVAPHIEFLYKEYFNRIDRMVAAQKKGEVGTLENRTVADSLPAKPVNTVAPEKPKFDTSTIKPAVADTSVLDNQIKEMEETSEWFKKAKSSIEAVEDVRALDILKEKIKITTKANMQEISLAIALIEKIRKEKFSNA